MDGRWTAEWMAEWTADEQAGHTEDKQEAASSGSWQNHEKREQKQKNNVLEYFRYMSGIDTIHNSIEVIKQGVN